MDNNKRSEDQAQHFWSDNFWSLISFDFTYIFLFDNLSFRVIVKIIQKVFFSSPASKMERGRTWFGKILHKIRNTWDLINHLTFHQKWTLILNQVPGNHKLLEVLISTCFLLLNCKCINIWSIKSFLWIHFTPQAKSSQ